MFHIFLRLIAKIASVFELCKNLFEIKTDSEADVFSRTRKSTSAGESRFIITYSSDLCIFPWSFRPRRSEPKSDLSRCATRS